MMTFEEILNELYMIIDELDARESNCNSIYAELTGIPWDDLCDKAIDLVKQLGGTKGEPQ